MLRIVFQMNALIQTDDATKANRIKPIFANDTDFYLWQL